MQLTKDQARHLDAARKRKIWDAQCEQSVTLGNRVSMLSTARKLYQSVARIDRTLVRGKRMSGKFRRDGVIGIVLPGGEVQRFTISLANARLLKRDIDELLESS